MTEAESADDGETGPDSPADESDPDKDSGATPTDHASDPENADLNAGTLSQPTSPDAD
jgi:hypothetical protein